LPISRKILKHFQALPIIYLLKLYIFLCYIKIVKKICVSFSIFALAVTKKFWFQVKIFLEVINKVNKLFFY
jgi:hypothetical protein